MILQDRDRSILELCYQQQFLLHEHIGEKFFANINPRRVRERIQELESAGFITQEKTNMLRGRAIIRLTPAGIAVAESRQTLKIPYAKKLDLITLEHDAHVTNVRLKLEKIWPNAKWLPERCLKANEFPQIPDGLVISNQSKKIAIEVENSDKGPTRFEKILAQWQPENADLVIYFVTQENLFHLIKERLARSPSKPLFAATLMSHFINGPTAVWTRFGEMEIFKDETF